MSTYNNGPGNIPKLPDRVVDTLINSAGVSRCTPGPSASGVIDQTACVERLVHDTCEELLARLPAAPAAPAVTVSPAPRVESDLLSMPTLKAIRDTIRPGDGWDGDDWDFALANAVAHHLARQAQPTDRDAEWISVDDDLPEVETDVLVRGMRGNSICHEVAGLFNGEWLGQNSERELRFIVAHWIPLPAIRALKGKSGEGVAAPDEKAVRIIDIGGRRQLRRDGESGWELVDEENKRVRYLNCFEANFVNSAIKAAGKSGSEGAADADQA